VVVDASSPQAPSARTSEIAAASLDARMPVTSFRVSRFPVVSVHPERRAGAIVGTEQSDPIGDVGLRSVGQERASYTGIPDRPAGTAVGSVRGRRGPSSSRWARSAPWWQRCRSV
jgi:hypothetical protein